MFQILTRIVKDVYAVTFSRNNGVMDTVNSETCARFFFMHAFYLDGKSERHETRTPFLALG